MQKLTPKFVVRPMGFIETGAPGTEPLGPFSSKHIARRVMNNVDVSMILDILGIDNQNLLAQIEASELPERTEEEENRLKNLSFRPCRSEDCEVEETHGYFYSGDEIDLEFCDMSSFHSVESAEGLIALRSERGEIDQATADRLRAEVAAVFASKEAAEPAATTAG